MMGGSKYLTLSTPKPLLYKLIARTLKENESDTAVVTEVKEKIKNDFQERYQDEDVTRLLNIATFSDDVMRLLNIATFIDPRYKELPFLDANDRKSITEEVEDELLALEGKVLVSDDLMEVNDSSSVDLDQLSSEPTEVTEPAI